MKPSKDIQPHAFNKSIMLVMGDMYVGKDHPTLQNYKGN